MEMESIIDKSKKLFPLVLKSSLFVTFCAITVIWYFLYRLGRLDVFAEAISFSSMLGVVFGFFILVCGMFGLFIFISSLMMILIVTNYNKHFYNFEEISHQFARVCFGNGWIVSIVFFPSLYFYTQSKWCGYFSSILLFVFAYACSCLMSFFFLRKPKAKLWLEQEYNEREFMKFKSIFVIPFRLLVPALLQLIPISVFVTQLKESVDVSNVFQLFSLGALSLVFFTLSILPGMVLITEYYKGTLFRALLLTAGILSAALFMLNIYMPVIPAFIANATMNLSGSNDWRTHQYFIKQSDLPVGLFSEKIWNTRSYQDLDGLFFITGVATFSFGNISLICPTTIVDIQKESLKYSFNSPKEDDVRKEKLKEAAMQCSPIEKSKIHQWDSPIKNPVLEN